MKHNHVLFITFKLISKSTPSTKSEWSGSPLLIDITDVFISIKIDHLQFLKDESIFDKIFLHTLFVFMVSKSTQTLIQSKFCKY